MLNHFDTFLSKAQLPEEGENALRRDMAALVPAYEEDLRGLTETMYASGCSMASTTEGREALAEKSGVSLYAVNALFILYASERMLADFRKAGIPDDIFWDTIMDVKYKLLECREVKGVWGTFVEFWYEIFFKLELFKLGRLEFQRTVYEEDTPYTCGDITIRKGDPVFGIHIPSCGSLSRELRMDSYRRAYEFFAKERGDKPLICACHSWLLFKGNREIFPSRLNLVDFMGDFDIAESKESEIFHDAWRVFGMDFDGDVSKLPQNTAQQKALAAWLEQGRKTGEGLGILIFDGSKIVNTRN